MTREEEIDRNAKDLAERICQQIDEEAVYGHVSGKWYYEKVFHYIQTINNLKEQSESEETSMESLKTCPFCGSDDIGVKDTILDHKMGQDCPCSTIRRVWAYCRRCGCEGRKTTIDSVYDSEIIAAATEAWNRRAY